MVGIRFGQFWGFIFAFFFVSSFAQAQMMCLDIFAVQKNAPEAETFTLLPRDMEILNSFEGSRAKLLEAESSKEANEWIYEVVTDANFILDFVAQNIWMLKSGKLDPALAQATAQSSQVLLSVLEVRLEVPRNILEQAVMVRIQKQVQSQMDYAASLAEKAPLGFNAREKTETEETIEKIRPGFTSKPEDTTAIDADAAEKNPIGFAKWNRETLTDEPAEKRSIGFMEWTRDPAQDASVQKNPAGFVDFGRPLAEVDVPLNRITFDLNTGEFNVEKPGFKLGF